MEDLKLKISNFLAIHKAELESHNNLVVIIAPNKSGKTQILKLLYAIYWSLWKVEIDEERFETIFQTKLKKTFLVKNINDLVTWDKKDAQIFFSSPKADLSLKISEERKPKLEFKINENYKLEKSPVYIHASGLGDFYKAIFILAKYHSSWNLIPQSVTDLIFDLIVTEPGSIESKEYQHILKKMEEDFSAKFYIQQGKVYVHEKNKSYILEKAASGLKTIAWLYLAMKHNLISKVLFIDEPENSLHPLYISKLTDILFELSKRTKIVMSTHSDYLLESLNRVIKKRETKVDVWSCEITEDGVSYAYYEADKENPIDSTPLTGVFLDILKETYK